MLTKAYKGGRGVGEMLDPPFLAYIICEQPLSSCAAIWTMCSEVQCTHGNIEQHAYPKTNSVLKAQNMLKSYTMLNGESQTC